METCFGSTSNSVSTVVRTQHVQKVAVDRFAGIAGAR